VWLLVRNLELSHARAKRVARSDGGIVGEPPIFHFKLAFALYAGHLADFDWFRLHCSNRLRREAGNVDHKVLPGGARHDCVFTSRRACTVGGLSRFAVGQFCEQTSHERETESHECPRRTLATAHLLLSVFERRKQVFFKLSLRLGQCRVYFNRVGQ